MLICVDVPPLVLPSANVVSLILVSEGVVVFAVLRSLGVVSVVLACAVIVDVWYL